MIVEMPRRNMLKVISPIFSKAMQEQDMKQVNRMYKKGSITMAVFGALLFIGILTNLNDLFIFIPQGNGFSEGFWVVVAVCITKLIVMIFSFSQEIIVFSSYYKYALYFQIADRKFPFFPLIKCYRPRWEKNRLRKCFRSLQHRFGFCWARRAGVQARGYLLAGSVKWTHHFFLSLLIMGSGLCYCMNFIVKWRLEHNHQLQVLGGKDLYWKEWLLFEMRLVTFFLSGH